MSEAYAWTTAPCPAPSAPLTPAQKPSHGGLTGWLDGKVEAALKASGLLHYLEKVTGDLDSLNAAAEEWQAQARAVRSVSEQLRAEGSAVAAQWEGDASDAFGRHMGEVVEALDSTAEGMDQTARITNQAATMCALAEGMVIDIISEAIEALAASLAAEAVITVLTFGIGAIAGAMLDAVEISAFIARVAKVSEELATSLEKLVEALKELNSAVKAVRSLKDAKEALNAFKEVKTALSAVRDVEKGGEGLGKIAKDAKEAKSLEGVGGKLADLAARKAAGKLDGYLTDQLTSHVEDGVRSTLFGDDEDDPVSASGRLRRGPKPAEGEEDERPPGLGSAVRGSVLGVVKGTAKDPAVQQAVEGEIGYRLQGTPVGTLLGDEDPEPYHVDRSRIERAFG